MGLLNYFINTDEELAQGGKKPEVQAVPVTPVEKDKVQFPLGYKQVTFPTETHLPTEPTHSEVFPTAASTPVYQAVSQPVNPFLEQIVGVYENTFNKLNQDGYDFFEYFKAVVKSGIDNPMVYEMALEMGISMGANTSKSLLLSQADYYINELNKTHDLITTDGQTKIADLTNGKNTEATSLTTDLDDLKQQLTFIQNQITEKQNALAQIGQKYQPNIDKITMKISANDNARELFVSKLNKVKINIQNNLK